MGAGNGVTKEEYKSLRKKTKLFFRFRISICCSLVNLLNPSISDISFIETIWSASNLSTSYPYTVLRWERVPINVRMEMLEKEKQAREALKIAIEERLEK